MMGTAEWEKEENIFSKLRIDMDAKWCTFALQWALFLALGMIEIRKLMVLVFVHATSNDPSRFANFCILCHLTCDMFQVLLCGGGGANTVMCFVSDMHAALVHVRLQLTYASCLYIPFGGMAGNPIASCVWVYSLMLRLTVERVLPAMLSTL